MPYNDNHKMENNSAPGGSGADNVMGNCFALKGKRGILNGEIMRKMQRGIFCAQIGLTLSVAAMTAMLAYGISANEISFENTMKSGSVDLKIEQYEMTHDGLKPIQQGQVLANQDVSYIPEIINLRADSYIRVKTEIIMDKDIEEPITLDNIYGLEDGWIRRGDYFYYTKPMEPMESAYLYKGIHVPLYRSAEEACGFKVELTADAIQASALTPDFDSPSPWGAVEIQEAKAEDSIVYRKVSKADFSKELNSQQANILRVTGDVTLESNTGNLFRNFDHFMAGSSYSDTLQIKNENERPVKVSFCADRCGGTLAGRANLEIYCGRELLYEGPVPTVPMNRYAELGEIPAGESVTM